MYEYKIIQLGDKKYKIQEHSFQETISQQLNLEDSFD